MFSITQASSAQLSEVLMWLEREYRESSEGFYCNKDVILESFANREMQCALLEGQPIGFIIHTRKSVGSSIDLLEIHPAHRRKGFGSRLARHAAEQLFSAGAEFVTVKCAPKSSEPFWRALGFSTATAQAASSEVEPLHLMLRNAA